MADVILVLNAGSSSLKFSVFEVAGEQLTLQLKGQIEGIGTAPQIRRQERRGRGARREGLGQGNAARARRRDRPPGRLPARASRRQPARRRRSPGGAWRRRLRRRRCGSTPEVIAALAKLEPAGAAAPAAQPQADRDRRQASARAAAGRLLRHRLPPRPARGGAGVRAAAVDHRSRACGATASTACPTNTSPTCCRSSSRRRRPAAPSSPTSATAAACARWWARRASPARWASPRSTACRWARAAATSIPAWCST